MTDIFLEGVRRFIAEHPGNLREALCDLGIDRQTWSLWKNGTCRPSGTSMDRITPKLGLRLTAAGN